MPITQNRLLSVIAVATRYRELIRAAHTAAHTARDSVIQQNLSANDALNTLIATVIRLSPDGEDMQILADETAHFRLNAKHNDAARRRAVKKKLRDKGFIDQDEDLGHELSFNEAPKATTAPQKTPGLRMNSIDLPALPEFPKTEQQMENEGMLKAMRQIEEEGLREGKIKTRRGFSQ